MPFSAQHIKAARLHLMQVDPVLKKIIKRIGPFTARMVPSPEAPALRALSDLDAFKRLLAEGKRQDEAEDFLIYSLGRLNILPLADPRLGEAVAREYDLVEPSAESIETLAAPWQPYSSVAAWYLLASVDNPNVE